MINLRIQTPEVQRLSPKIMVVGVGGAGGNAVNNMISSGLEGCGLHGLQYRCAGIGRIVVRCPHSTGYM